MGPGVRCLEDAAGVVPEPASEAVDWGLGDRAAPGYAGQPGLAPRTPSSSRCVAAAPAHCWTVLGALHPGVIPIEEGRGVLTDPQYSRLLGSAPRRTQASLLSQAVKIDHSNLARDF